MVAADYAPFFADHAPITQMVIADHQIASASINAVSSMYLDPDVASLMKYHRVVV